MTGVHRCMLLVRSIVLGDPSRPGVTPAPAQLDGAKSGGHWKTSAHGRGPVGRASRSKSNRTISINSVSSPVDLPLTVKLTSSPVVYFRSALNRRRRENPENSRRRRGLTRQVVFSTGRRRNLTHKPLSGVPSFVIFPLPVQRNSPHSLVGTTGPARFTS